MRQLGWVLLLLSCNPSRDGSDEAVESSLDLVLAERQDLEANRAVRQAEQDQIKEVLSRFQPVTAGELVTLAGPAARLVQDSPQGFYRIVTISALGPRSEAFRFARAALAHSRVINLGQLVLTPSAWIVTLTVMAEPPSRPVAGSGFTPAADTSWCYADCRERQKRIVDKNAQLSALDRSLGGLAMVNRDRKRLKELLSIDSKFIGDEVGPALDQLEQAQWLPPDADVSFSPRALTIMGPPGAAPACRATFASCEYSEAHRALQVSLGETPR